MLEEDKTDIRIARHSITQEDFTPEYVCSTMADLFPDDVYSDFSKTVIDPCSGIGNLLITVITRRLSFCHSNEEVYAAISTVYGTELMPDNVAESHKNILYNIMLNTSKKGLNLDESHVLDILHSNIVCTDTFKWDYENWCPLKELKSKSLF